MPYQHDIISYEGDVQTSHHTLRGAIEDARHNNTDQIDIRLRHGEFLTLRRDANGKWVLAEIQ